MTLQTRLEKIPEPNNSYFRAFFRHKSLVGLADSTIGNYLDGVIVFLQHYGVDRDLKEVTRNDIEEFVFWYKAKSKPSTTQIKIISLKVFFADLLGDETATALFKDIKMKVPLVKVRDEQLLSTDEIKSMIAACRSERDRALITLLYASGCRCGEILGLKVRDITFSRYGASIHVNGKTGERDVDLFVGVPELKAYYNVHPHRDDPESDFWLTGEGGTLSYRGLTCMLERVAAKADIPKNKKINPHSFRHKRATDCAEFMTVSDMKEMFGWTDGSNMPAVYVHSSRERVAEKLMKQAGIKVPEQHMPTMMVKQCPVCGCVNTAEATVCYACSNPLDPKTAFATKEGREFLLDNAEAIIAAYNNLKKNEKNPDQHA